MEERPILFSEKMVQAILHAGIRESVFVKSGLGDGHGHEIKSPYGYVGDILWVRETWGVHPFLNGVKPSALDESVARRSLVYRADIPQNDSRALILFGDHLPLCRDGQCVVDTAVSDFAQLWDEINFKRGYSWESNPFVWAISFRHVGCTTESAAAALRADMRQMEQRGQAAA